ncbi:hypothetical protein JNJ66_00920 [Candidatus Saccharibacteria bacterium]|nr:hypothetical protein [Candidatus Saccharibacteria bacterium]
MTTPGPPPGVTVLLPTREQFAVDEPVRAIVEALRNLGWQAPGIRIRFTEPTGPYCWLETIEGPEWQLLFAQPIARPRPGDILGVETINIPRMQLTVYADESGPVLTLYTGPSDRWPQDRERFRGRRLAHYLQPEEPWFQTYAGGALSTSDGAEAWTPGQRQPLMAHTTMGGLSFPLLPEQPPEVKTQDVLEDFEHWLTTHILEPLLARDTKETGS